MNRKICMVILLTLPMTMATADDNANGLIANTKHFAFYSDLETNLHDALLIAGGAESRESSTWFQDGKQLECLESLPNSMRSGWALAVKYYESVISPNSWSDRQQSLIRLDLAGVSSGRDDNARQFNQLSRHVRGAAAPAYAECLWPEQDAKNRAWVARLMPQLTNHETEVADRLAALYATDWHGLPLRADIVADAPPLGANSIVLNPSGGHLLISTRVADEDALEITFHEAAHTIANSWRGDPLPVSISEAAARLEMEAPGDLWHVILFYLTGVTVDQALASAGHEEYEPYMIRHGLWNGRWGGYRQAIEASMPAYLSGDTTLQEAVGETLRKLSDLDKAP